jgi:hypothetical protein
MKHILFVLVGSTLLVACATSAPSLARTRAANDLACPASSIVVRELASGTIEATGCGRRAVYTCPRSGSHRVCIRETATGPSR